MLLRQTVTFCGIDAMILRQIHCNERKSPNLPPLRSPASVPFHRIRITKLLVGAQTPYLLNFDGATAMLRKRQATMTAQKFPSGILAYFLGSRQPDDFMTKAHRKAGEKGEKKTGEKLKRSKDTAPQIADLCALLWRMP